MQVESNIVMAGEEKAMAEKSPMGSFSIAAKTQSSMRPPRTAWQETSSRVFRSGKVKRLEVVDLRMTGLTSAIWRQQRSSRSCQELAGVGLDEGDGQSEESEAKQTDRAADLAS